MNLFISWSGSKSLAAAKLIHDFIPQIVQSATLFMSTEDMPAGSSWISTLRSSIQSAEIAAIVITAENVGNPWLLFEAGAISAHGTTVVPLLVDISPVDLSGPLAFFQCAVLNREGVQQLLHLINERAPKAVSQPTLDKLFDAFWPDFERQLGQLPESVTTSEAMAQPQEARPLRTSRDLLEEILQRVERLEATKSRKLSGREDR